MTRGPGLVPTMLLVAGLIFLYVPTALVIGYSFNESRLVSVWTGFSLKWYAELVNDSRLMGAARTSILIAISSASLATIFGTAAGVALGQLRVFRGRTVLSALIVMPLVMPEVITGISLLLLFVALEQIIGWPSGRGALTVIVAHTTLSLAYVALIVQARLAGMPRDLAEAAADLGGAPFAVFTRITLPLLAPAIGAGWLLSFVLSLDDLVIASFTSGPQSTTLPMVVFSSVRLGVSPKVNALATVLIATSALILLAVAWLQRRPTRQTRKG
jgi:putrescine transport system permease protein